MSLKKDPKESAVATGSIKSVTSVVDLPLDKEERRGNDSVEKGQNSNALTCNSSEELLTSLVFAIPLPCPEKGYLSAQSDATSRQILLYTLPRAVYEKPPKNPETGKSEKEKISKKIVRSWNKSIQDGEDIKRGDMQSPSITKKCLGALFRWTACSLRFITSCDDQMLSRLPPIKKLGQVQIICLGDPTIPIDSNQSQSQTSLSPEKAVEEIFLHEIFQAKKETTIRIILSGCILPIALAAEIFVPLVFEICLIYFLVQYRGWKKVKLLLKKYQMEKNRLPVTGNDLENGNSDITEPTSSTFKFQVIEPEICQEINKLTYDACSQVDSQKFPILQDTSTTNSQVVTNQNEVVEITAILPFESDSKSTIDSDTKKDLPVVDLTSITEPARIPTECITIELQYNDKNIVTLDQAQTIDKNSQPTYLTQAVEKDKLQDSAVAEVSSINEATPNEPQPDQKAMTTTTESGTNQKTNTKLPSSDQKNEPKPIPNIEIATMLIKLFEASLPPEVVSRHELNKRRVAEDFNRVLTRRTKEYVKSIKKSA